MPIIGEANLGALGPAGRFDAEYYQPKYVELYRLIDALSTVPLERVANVSDGDHAAIPGFVPNGVRYLRGERPC